MKLVIEINDETLKRAIQQQLNAAVAEQVGKQIDAVVDGVLNKKLERFTDEVIGNRIEQTAMKLLRQQLGRDDWSRDAAIKRSIVAAAETVVREQFKK